MLPLDKVQPVAGVINQTQGDVTVQTPFAISPAPVDVFVMQEELPTHIGLGETSKLAVGIVET